MADVTDSTTQTPPDQAQGAPAPAAPATDTQPRVNAITSLANAQAVARLIKDGKITGAGRDRALADLRAFHNSEEYEKTAHGDVKNPVERMGWLERGVRGFGAQAQQAGRGILEAVADSPTLMGRAMREKGTDQALRQQVDQSNQQNAALMSTPAAKVGGALAQTAVSAPAGLVGGAGIAGAALTGGAIGAAQPVGQGEDRTANVLGGALGGVGGNVVGRLAGAAGEAVAGSKVGKAIASKMPARFRAQPTTPEPVPGVTKAARRALAADYDLPPSMAKEHPSSFEHAVEGIGGKIRTEQKMSIKNQFNTDNIAKRDIKLPEAAKGDDNTITKDDLAYVRRREGDTYQEVRDLDFQKLPNRVNYLQPTKEFNDALTKIDGTFKDYSKRFPAIFKNSKIQELSKNLRRLKTPDDAVEISNELRQQASDNMSARGAQTRKLGRAQRRMADAVDKLIEDNLNKASAKHPEMKDLYDRLIRSRQIIAKTYDIEAALDPSGHVDAVKLARIGEKRPLSGGLAEIAHFGANFKGAARVPNRIGSRYGPDFSKSEIGIGSAIAAASGGSASAAKTLVKEAAAVGAPSVARRYLGSKAYQNTIRPKIKGDVGIKEGLRRGFTVGGSLTLKDNMPRDMLGRFKKQDEDDKEDDQ